MSDYATTQEIAAQAQEPPDNDVLAGLATAASRLFDKLCQVEDGFFAATTGESDKVVYGDGTAYLKLPPYVGTLGTDPIVIVDDNDEEQEVPDYFEQNGYLVIRGYGQGVPTRDLSDAALVASSFTGWPRNFEITVSANWGFETIPADVKQAVVQLAIHLWRLGDPAFTAISQSGQPYQPPAIPTQVKAIADEYRKKYQQNAAFA